MYSLKINTYKTPIVITMNKEADWDAMKAEPWVRENCMVIDCGSRPMYKAATGGTEVSDEPQSQQDASQACRDCLEPCACRRVKGAGNWVWVRVW